MFVRFRRFCLVLFFIFVFAIPSIPFHVHAVIVKEILRKKKSNPKISHSKVSHSKVSNPKVLKSYLLPRNHPLRPHLKSIFKKPHMFKSARHLTKAGFTVIHGHKKLMVASHPTIKNYLFKKFPDSRSQNSQLKNFIERIEGAKKLRKFIGDHNFKNLIVPQKWLYALPKRFSNSRKGKSYILIVEKMDIYNDSENPQGEAMKLYYHMNKDILTELCMTLHGLGGCDGYPRNQPFTRSGKIAFVDTEHVGKLKGHFTRHIIPALNENLQAYAWTLWMKLENEEKQTKIRLKRKF